VKKLENVEELIIEVPSFKRIFIVFLVLSIVLNPIYVGGTIGLSFVYSQLLHNEFFSFTISLCSVFIIFFIGVYILFYFRCPPLHLKITPKGHFIYYGRKESIPICVGEIRELKCYINKDLSTGWSSFILSGPFKTWREEFLSFNDTELIEDCLKRHAINYSYAKQNNTVRKVKLVTCSYCTSKYPLTDECSCPNCGASYR
jgi:hypothetical protein